MNKIAPTGQALIRKTNLAKNLALSPSGIEKLGKKDPTFPKPIKDGASRQAAAYYVVAEIEAWLQAKIDARDAA